MNPRHSAWEADALRRYPAHPQRVTSSTIHPLPRPLPRPASSRCTSLHDRQRGGPPRAASASGHRRHPWPPQRAAGAPSGRGGGRSRSPPGGCHAARPSRRESGTNAIQVARTTATRTVPLRAELVADLMDGNRDTPALRLRRVARTNRSLAQPRGQGMAGLAMRPRTPRSARSELPARSSASSLWLRIALRSRLPTTVPDRHAKSLVRYTSSAADPQAKSLVRCTPYFGSNRFPLNRSPSRRIRSMSSASTSRSGHPSKYISSRLL